jgi:Domain of unknown function (DU1801)
MKRVRDPAVAAVFNGYPPKALTTLMALRKLIFATAADKGVGELEETLKWGEPAYVTKSGSGSTVRLGWKAARPNEVAIYFHCQTSLVETFRTLFPTELRYEGNRAIVFDQDAKVPTEVLGFCIAAALTYHRDKMARKTK